MLRRFICVPPPTLAHALAVLGLPTLENSTLFFSIDSWIFIGKLKKNKELFCQRSKAQNCPQAILHNASYIIVQEKMIFLLFFIGIFSFTIIALCKIAARPTLPTLAQSPQGLCSFFVKIAQNIPAKKNIRIGQSLQKIELPLRQDYPKGSFLI